MKNTLFIFLGIVLVGATSAPNAHAQLPDFTQLVENHSAAVVNVSTKGSSKLGKHIDRELPDLRDNPFGNLLDHFFGPDFGYDQIPKELFMRESLGSGFVISDNGYILTNHHVVKGADEIIVRFKDRREFVAKLIGSDKQTDVALIKIEAKNLPTVKIGSGESLRVGEWVLAIGSPFGFDHSVTAGIISAKGRSLPTENYVPFIQTDVAINPGNSGGPLFNLKGEVVGINSQIYSRNGGFMGLSFSIPIEVAMNVADQLRTTGQVSRGWLGVLIQDVSREMAQSFGLGKPRGALVAKVLPNSPAAHAGIQSGDIILKYNNKLISRSSALPPLVGTSPVNKAVEVVVYRQGIEKILMVNIGEYHDDLQISQDPSLLPRNSRVDELGIEIAELTMRQRREMNIHNGGVVITHVIDGPARNAGIRKGEVILMVKDHRVRDVADFKQIIGSFGPGPIAILIQRGDESRWTALTLE